LNDSRTNRANLPRFKAGVCTIGAALIYSKRDLNRKTGMPHGELFATIITGLD